MISRPTIFRAALCRFILGHASFLGARSLYLTARINGITLGPAQMEGFTNLTLFMALGLNREPSAVHDAHCRAPPVSIAAGAYSRASSRPPRCLCSRCCTVAPSRTHSTAPSRSPPEALSPWRCSSRGSVPARCRSLVACHSAGTSMPILATCSHARHALFGSRDGQVSRPTSLNRRRTCGAICGSWLRSRLLNWLAG